jgi:predicted TIM-barrel fold metal-dependent hydrolase
MDKTADIYKWTLISTDSHVNEPPDLWTSRVSGKYLDRVPRMQRFEEGDAWIFDGVADPINFGHNACAGLDPADIRTWVRFEDIRPGGWDSAARLVEMDKDGIFAEVLYPTPRVSQGITANPDVDLHLTMVRAYNDWMSEYVERAPSRFGGLAILPNCGVPEALAELDRVCGRPGIRGVVINCYPNGSLEPKDDDDKVWGELTERGIPLNIHVGLSLTLPTAHRLPIPGFGRFIDPPQRMMQLCFSGVFERFPSLQLVFAEVDCGWVPYFKEQLDELFLRFAPTAGFRIRERPGSYIDRNVHFTFMNDAYGVRNRHDVGVERMMWSSDYPHISGNWPTSWRSLNATFSGVPAAERSLILSGNAARLYGFTW